MKPTRRQRSQHFEIQNQSPFFQVMQHKVVFSFLCLLSSGAISLTSAFTPSSSGVSLNTRISSFAFSSTHLLNSISKQEEAKVLKEKAKQLRKEIAESATTSKKQKKDDDTTSITKTKTMKSEWSVEPSKSSDGAISSSTMYRLYIDIGREDGSWMDPRWGASGRRIESTLDVCFSTIEASPAIKERMVQDNQNGKSSNVSVIETATRARLKGGFDSMKVQSGGYRVDNGGAIRFYVSVEGTKEGDVSIPEGNLYFSLPCFIKGKSSGTTSIEKVLLSTTEGICSVRQIGWHTGWRRQESRIVGVFRAVPIKKAHHADGY